MAKTFGTRYAFQWQSGYAAFTVSHSMRSRVIRYVERQEEHHRKRSFEDEFIAFLKAHGVAYDPQHVWD